MDIDNVVLVKSYPNDPVVRKIIGEDKDFAEICLEKQSRWDESKPKTVRCPKSRIYSYDPNLCRKLTEAAYELRDNQLLETLWKQARLHYDIKG